MYRICVKAINETVCRVELIRVGEDIARLDISEKGRQALRHLYKARWARLSS